jgi:hypothetical protein
LLLALQKRSHEVVPCIKLFLMLTDYKLSFLYIKM